jgi:hypothetical protein
MVFGPAFGTRFSLTVDTEEEFAWGQGFARDQHGTDSVPAIAEGQRFFAGAGVVPLYYVDTPVISADAAPDVIGPVVADGSADIGVHLHPWVTPPFVEAVSSYNSYAGNLPEAIERSKLRTIRDLVEQRIGHRPIAYRAGRYGIGPNTLAILKDEGFRCDSSIRSLFTYHEDGGPDFRNCGLTPYWAGEDGAILELPLTTVFTGRGSRFGRTVYGRLDAVPSLRAMLARSRLIERIPLTPEGIPLAKACDAIDVAQDIGLPLLTFSFHSPSLAPGYTPYVRTRADLAAFYRWFDGVFDHLARRGIANANLAAILAAADTARAPSGDASTLA